MSLATVDWHSAILGKRTTMRVILPDVGKPPYATFYLLHGLSDDSSMWLRRSRIEWYVRNLPIVVVMPDGYRGFYTDNDEGPAYARHFGEEMIAFVEKMFPVKKTRASRAIGGLSMGGYGALRLALGYPDKFCSVNSHSGAVGWGALEDEARFRKEAESRGWSKEFLAEMFRVFGKKPAGTSHDLSRLATAANKAGKLPNILLDCGSEDFLIDANRWFTGRLSKLKVPHLYREFPGVHDWDYWDTHIQDALAFHAKNLKLKV